MERNRTVADGWTEISGKFRSDDLPRYLRLARLQGHLWEFAVKERLTADALADDLLYIVENIKHRAPLPGTPVQIDLEGGPPFPPK